MEDFYKSNYEYLSEEFDCKLKLIIEYLECKKEKNFEIKRKEVLKTFRYLEMKLKLKLKSSSKEDFFSAQYVREVYHLTDLEWFCLIIAIMYHADIKYKNIILKIENEDSLTYAAILKLYFFVEDISEINEYYSVLSVCSEKMNSLCFMGGIPKIDLRLFENIMSNYNNDLEVPGLKIYIPRKGDNKKLTIREDTATNIFNFLSKSERFKSTYVFLYGSKGIGKKTIVNRVCSLNRKGVVYLNFSMINDSNFEEIIFTACREAFFAKGYILFYNVEKTFNEKNDMSKLYLAINIANKFSKVVFILSEKRLDLNNNFSHLDFLHISLPDLNIEESFELWKECLSGVKLNKDVDISEFASKFNLSCTQIKNSVSEALIQNELKNEESLSSQTLSECIYNQLTKDLETKATLIKKKHTMNELVLNPKEKGIISQACNQVKYRHIVYSKWGMNKRILYGSGVSMLFAGASGTGKTMAAQVIANELKMEIYKVDLSRVISKYIGESEKNLGEVFDLAKKSNVILLFDETDAIFAKRTEVKDSHDRNANLETSYLLQKMEEHTGITILTTNFLENIDKAFFRRINYVVHFEFPDANSRKKIWKSIYTKEVPLSKDVDFEFLAKQFEISGGNIKNAALTSAFMAASERKKVTMKHIVKALEYEIKKQGKMVSKEDFGEYGYLL